MVEQASQKKKHYSKQFFERKLRQFLVTEPYGESIVDAMKADDYLSAEGLRMYEELQPKEYKKVISLVTFARECKKFLSSNHLEHESDPRSLQQLFVLHSIYHFFLQRRFNKVGNIMGYIEQPPGTGKTRLLSLLTGLAYRSGLKVLIITPKLDINQQTYDTIIGEKSNPADMKIPLTDVSVQDSAHKKNPNALNLM